MNTLTNLIERINPYQFTIGVAVAFAFMGLLAVLDLKWRRPLKQFRLLTARAADIAWTEAIQVYAVQGRDVLIKLRDSYLSALPQEYSTQLAADWINVLDTMARSRCDHLKWKLSDSNEGRGSAFVGSLMDCLSKSNMRDEAESLKFIFDKFYRLERALIWSGECPDDAVRLVNLVEAAGIAKTEFELYLTGG